MLAVQSESDEASGHLLTDSESRANWMTVQLSSSEVIQNKEIFQTVSSIAGGDKLSTSTNTGHLNLKTFFVIESEMRLLNEKVK